MELLEGKMTRTSGREAISTKQEKIAKLARREPQRVLTTLAHHIDVVWLREAYRRTRKTGAAGVDGVSSAQYEAHLEGRCPAGRCLELISYHVTDACTGCTICVQHCPADAIPFTPYRKHEIDTQRCTACDVCRSVCPEDAIEVR